MCVFRTSPQLTKLIDSFKRLLRSLLASADKSLLLLALLSLLKDTDTVTHSFQKPEESEQIRKILRVCYSTTCNAFLSKSPPRSRCSSSSCGTPTTASGPSVQSPKLSRAQSTLTQVEVSQAAASYGSAAAAAADIDFSLLFRGFHDFFMKYPPDQSAGWYSCFTFSCVFFFSSSYAIIFCHDARFRMQGLICHDS